jgi:glucose-6-phosphate-specific signal transduction histidine kinase
MLIVAIACALLIGLATVIHYEALSGLNGRLTSLAIPNRTKLLVVIFTAFIAHALEMALYGLTFYFLVKYFGVGTLKGPAGLSLASCLYFSAETYTSLGFGDLTPIGPIRMIAGVEALNGLLLIGWSASYAYIAMERFWSEDASRRRR